MKQNQYIRGLMINIEIRNKIKDNPMIHQYMSDYSQEYKMLYRNANYIKTIEKKARETYKKTTIDKLKQVREKIDILKTFISIMK